jgi:hypothetical protein
MNTKKITYRRQTVNKIPNGIPISCNISISQSLNYRTLIKPFKSFSNYFAEMLISVEYLNHKQTLEKKWAKNLASLFKKISDKGYIFDVPSCCDVFWVMWQYVTTCGRTWKHVAGRDNMWQEFHDQLVWQIINLDCESENFPDLSAICDVNHIKHVYQRKINVKMKLLTLIVLLWMRRTSRSIIKITFTIENANSNAAYPSLHSYFVLKDRRNIRRIQSL